MSAQRYSIDAGTWGPRIYCDPDGEWVRAEDCERERRWWAVRFMRERALRLGESADMEAEMECFDDALRFEKQAATWSAMADAIERGDRLEYFARLGASKGDE